MCLLRSYISNCFLELLCQTLSFQFFYQDFSGNLLSERFKLLFLEAEEKRSLEAVAE